LTGNFGIETHGVGRRDPPRIDRGWTLHQRLLIRETQWKENYLWSGDRRTGSGGMSFLASVVPKGFRTCLGCSGNWEAGGLGCFEMAWVEISSMFVRAESRNHLRTLARWFFNWFGTGLRQIALVLLLRFLDTVRSEQLWGCETIINPPWEEQMKPFPSVSGARWTNCCSRGSNSELVSGGSSWKICASPLGGS